MPQPTKGARLGGSPAHQRLILANLATSLFQHGKITTTEAKAKRLRPYAERLITKAKRGDLHNRREIQKVIRDREIVHRLMHEIGPFFADRNGGYTRITKTLPRQGDNAPMAIIELVSQKTVTDEADRARRVAGSQQRRERRGGAAEAGPTAGQNAVDEAEGSTATATESTESGETAEVVEKAEEASEAALEAAAAAPEGSVAQEKAFDAADSAEQAADAAVEESASTADAPYGEGSHAPLDDPSEAPEGFPVKGNEDSKKYHVPESPHYGRTIAEVWFASPEAAEAAGFEAPGGSGSDS